jgi:hypothetical protein
VGVLFFLVVFHFISLLARVLVTFLMRRVSIFVVAVMAVARVSGKPLRGGRASIINDIVWLLGVSPGCVLKMARGCGFSGAQAWPFFFCFLPLIIGLAAVTKNSRGKGRPFVFCSCSHL